MEVDNPQEPKDGGGTSEEDKSPDPMSPPAVQESATPCSVTWKACLSTRSNLDSSLVCLTRNFADLMKRSAQGVLDLNYACRILNVPKRRLYDVTNALEGAHLITKKMKNSVQWLGPVTHQDFAQELRHLEEKEMKLDQLIESCTLQIYQLFENQQDQRFAYLTYEDLSRIPNYKEQTMIVIKAPAGTNLNVPHPDESLNIHVVSRNGPIEAFLCPDQPDPDHCHANNVQKASANGNHSSPQAGSPSLHVHAKDNAFRASDTGPVGSPRAQESRQEPAATSPPSQCLAEGDRQSFLSLTSPLNFSPGGEERPPSAMEEQGITDLFSSVDPEQMPLDLPV